MMYRSKKILKAVREFDCQRCGRQGGGQTIAAHANWQQYGKGAGLKAHDCFVAALCHACHEVIDGRAGNLSGQDAQEQWEAAWVKTLLLLFLKGIVR